jgi:pimeloyl-ACP methyl ester carboxylesterase
MAVSDALGERRTVEVPAGTLEYRERGTGPPLVFVHGVAVNADLWRKVVPELAGDRRCIALDVPLGGHSIALDGEPDLSLFGVARIVADFLEALDLSDVAIVSNDTGGAVSQALAGSHPERLGRLVLTSCDAFENFPPKAVAYLPWLARVPGAFRPVGQALRLRPLQRLPITYGWATHRPIEPRIVDS